MYVKTSHNYKHLSIKLKLDILTDFYNYMSFGYFTKCKLNK